MQLSVGEQRSLSNRFPLRIPAISLDFFGSHSSRSFSVTAPRAKRIPLGACLQSSRLSSPSTFLSLYDDTSRPLPRLTQQTRLALALCSLRAQGLLDLSNEVLKMEKQQKLLDNSLANMIEATSGAGYLDRTKPEIQAEHKAKVCHCRPSPLTCAPSVDSIELPRKLALWIP